MGVNADMWVLPEGAKVYLGAIRKENFDFFIRGPGGEQSFRDTLADKQGLGYVDVNNDCAIYEAKQFEVPGQAEPVDVLQRHQTVGEYYTMHGTRGTDWREYNSASRDILVYNEDRDSFSRITLENGIDNCCRFTPEGSHDDGQLDWSRVLPGDVSDKDMFKMDDGSGENANRYGDMSKNALQREGLLDMAAGIAAGLSDDVAKDLEAGLELCRRIEDAEPDTTTGGFMTNVVDAYTAHNVGNALPTKWGFDAERNLPEPDPASVPANPTGYSNFPGMEIFAKSKYAGGSQESKAIHETATKFVSAVDKLYARLDEAVYDSCFLDADYQAPWFKKPDGRNVLFSSLLHMVQPPMWVKGGVKGAALDGKLDVSQNLTAEQSKAVGLSGRTVTYFGTTSSKGPANYKLIEVFMQDQRTATTNAFSPDGSVNVGQFTNAEGLEKILAVLLCSVTSGDARLAKPYGAVSQEEAGLMKETAQLFMACMPAERANLLSTDNKDVSFAVALLIALKKYEKNGVKLVDIYRIMRKLSTARGNEGFRAGLQALSEVVDAVKTNTLGGQSASDYFDNKLTKKVSAYEPEATAHNVNERGVEYIPTALTASAAIASKVYNIPNVQIGYNYSNRPETEPTGAVLGARNRGPAGDRANLKARQVRAALGANDTAAAGLGAREYGVRADRGEKRVVGREDNGSGKKPRFGADLGQFKADLGTWGDGGGFGGDGARQMRDTEYSAGGIYISFSNAFDERFREFNRFTNVLQRVIIQVAKGRAAP